MKRTRPTHCLFTATVAAGLFLFYLSARPLGAPQRRHCENIWTTTMTVRDKTRLFTSAS